MKIKGKEKQIHKFVFVAGFMRVRLGDVCEKGSSNLKQSDVIGKNGEYEIYGASGLIGKVDFFHQEKPYIAVVKDGAGIGRTMLLPEKTSVIGTMQYILPNEKVIPKYLYYVIRYMHLEKYFTGATIPHIYFKDYKREEFNLCDLSEQEKIVSTLSKIEKIITHRKQQLEKLDLLVKARFVEMFGDPEFNNYNWDTFKMAELCTVSSSKRVYQSELTNEGVPFLRISDLVNRMDYNTETCDLFISEEKYSDLLNNGLVPQKDDILVTARGTLGRCYIVKDTDRFYFQDGMITWLSSYSEKIIPVYISYLFSMHGIKKQIEEMQAGSTVAYLSIAMTKKLSIMLPPLDLQTQFADFVQQVDKSRVAIQNDLEQAQMLFDSLMQEYFG